MARPALQCPRILTYSTRVTRVALKPGLFEPLDDPAKLRLIGGRCGKCERVHFPAQGDCPYCGATDCAATPLSPTGTVHLCTTVLTRPPGYDGVVPYGFGVIELPENVRIIARLDADTPAGTPVRLILESIGTDAEGNEIVTYAFQKSQDTSHQ